MTDGRSKGVLDCPRCGSTLHFKMKDRCKPIALAYFAGFPDGRGDSDPAFLRNLAGWLDLIDDAAEASLLSSGIEHEVGRTVQAEVRRIADRLGDAIALGDA